MNSAPSAKSRKGTRGKVRFLHHARHDFRAEAQGLAFHDLHQFGPHDAVFEAGEVLHFVGDGQLSARLKSLEEDGPEFGARAV